MPESLFYRAAGIQPAIYQERDSSTDDLFENLKKKLITSLLQNSSSRWILLEEQYIFLKVNPIVTANISSAIYQKGIVLHAYWDHHTTYSSVFPWKILIIFLLLWNFSACWTITNVKKELVLKTITFLSVSVEYQKCSGFS